jgi:hypothetical protein
MALHNYFLNADYLRDVFLRRLTARPTRAEPDVVWSKDTEIVMSLWYANVYVVIEGWRETGYNEPTLDELLKDPLVDHLRIFRNQVFHCQKDYDNPKLLRFLGENDAAAKAATDWITETHIALGSAIEAAISGLVK